MNLQFHYRGTVLDKTEAAALIEAARGNAPIDIDLGKLIDNRKLTSKNLFDLAVKHAKPELAALAWKVSINKESNKQSDILLDKINIVKTSEIKASAAVLAEDVLIHKIASSQSYWSAGAALILCTGSAKSWSTLRQISVDFVNHCFDFNLVPENSTLFKGFERSRQNTFVPINAGKDTTRKDTYHLSPLYIGLRDGLVFCQKQGLTETKSSITTGLSTGEPGRNVERGSLSRIFYEVKLTEKGEALKNNWSDIEDYPVSIFRNRLQ